MKRTRLHECQFDRGVGNKQEECALRVAQVGQESARVVLSCSVFLGTAFSHLSWVFAIVHSLFVLCVK